MTELLVPTPTTELPLRPQDEVECRRCEVHCDKVVYPGSCVERACAFVYAYEAFGHTYMGCMQRVFDVEIDLDLLRAAERRRDGFGAVVARRAPLPMCHAEVESCYEQRGGRGRLPQPRVLRDAGSAHRASASSPSCRTDVQPPGRSRAAAVVAPGFSRAPEKGGFSLPSAWPPPAFPACSARSRASSAASGP